MRQDAAAKELRIPKQLTIDLGSGIPLKLILIPAGKFMMGSSETETSSWPTAGSRRTNETLHEVTITRAFYMSAYKITQKQYEQIIGTNPSQFPGKNHPVDAVTWDDAARFCQRASAKTNRKIHLPTEAQWEYAARAGTSTRYFFGEDESKIGDYAWYRENSGGKTHPVGEKPPNAWGLFDVHGLLWEYCSDFFSDSYGDSNSTDPTGSPSGTSHSTRAGTYGSRPPFVRSAIRVGSPAAEATKEMLNHFGFRVAVDVDSASVRITPNFSMPSSRSRPIQRIRNGSSADRCSTSSTKTSSTPSLMCRTMAVKAGRSGLRVWTRKGAAVWRTTGPKMAA